MSEARISQRSALPSVDRLLRHSTLQALSEETGRAPVLAEARACLAELRQSLADGGEVPGDDALAALVVNRVRNALAPSLRPVFNLTGTVLHTNLGRAPLPEEAIEAIATVARGASNLEYDITDGRRGDRDSHLEELLCRLTGAEAATVVNNNAAAVLLLLNTLAQGREVPVSRGELIEIGGAFRMPDIMARAGCRLIEIGTTNRTHLRDYENAIGAETAALMKVHTSNYVVQGFTASVPEAELAALAHRHALPFIDDLGSGSLFDLEAFGLPHEPTVTETLQHGADLVTFSGDKLLGGPQAGLIAGRADLIAAVKRNPMKRAMRCDKMTIAALAAVLRLYTDPATVVRRLPALRQLARPQQEIRATAERLRGAVAEAAGDAFACEIRDCRSQIGSGAMPVDRLDSAALVLSPARPGKGAGALMERLATAFRALPLPVIGRVRDDAFWLDLRCLEDEDGFLRQLAELRVADA